MSVDDDAVLRALAHPERRRVLLALRDGPRTAGELLAGARVAASTLSGHFSVLRLAGLVESTRRGSTVTYELVPGVVEAVTARLAADFEETS